MDVQEQMLAMLLALSSTVLLPAGNENLSWPGGPERGPGMGRVRTRNRKDAIWNAIPKPSGDSDIDFARLMLPIIRRQMDMAKTELVYGKDPQMRRLAQEILTDQQSETE